MSSAWTLSVPVGTVNVPLLTAVSTGAVEPGEGAVVEEVAGTLSLDDVAATDVVDALAAGECVDASLHAGDTITTSAHPTEKRIDERTQSTFTVRPCRR
jgi:hypothetical protein